MRVRKDKVKQDGIIVTIAAERWLRDEHFESEQHRERVLEEAKRQSAEVGFSIVTKSDLQRAMRSTDRGRH